MLMRIQSLLPVALLLATPALAQEQNDKLRGDLPSVLAASAAGDLVPVTIVLASHVKTAELRAMAAGMTKVERRATIVAHLEQVAADTQGDLLELLAARGAQSINSFWIHNMIGAEVTPATVHELAGRDDVLYVHRNVKLKIEDILTLAPTPAPAGNPTCGLDLIRAPEVWAQRGINGDGVLVALIDSGLCTGHSDIQSRLWTNPGEIPGNGTDDDNNGYVDDVRGWGFDSNTNDIQDPFAHGSHVAGTVAGDGTKGTASGVAPGARIMVCKVSGSFAGEQEVWDSMQYAVANGADISTASLGWPHSVGPDRATWRMVCENSIATGLVVIYAAGNEGGSVNDPDNVRTPGDVPDVLTVGAVDCGDNLASFSSRGPVTWENVAPYNDHPFPPGYKKPDVCAEGANTTSHNLCSGYVNFAGTSMATPHVAGAAALILQADPTLDHFGVKALLEASCVDLGNNGKDNLFGWGRIDCLVAVDGALSSGNFCTPKLTSCGTIPLIWTDGDALASASSGFTVNATNLPGSSLALLVYTDQGGANTPLLGGHLCVASILRGVPVGTTGTNGLCDGMASFDMNAFGAGALGGFPAGFLQAPGTTVNAQWWARDPANTYGAVLTGGARYTIAP